MIRPDRRPALVAAALAGALGCGTGDDDVTRLPVVITDAGAKADGDATTAPPSDAATTTPPPSGPSSYLRLADWSPAAPAVDFCLATPDSGAFYGPLLGTAFVTDGSAPAVPFPIASAYMAIPAGTFDMRVVAAGASGCSVSLGDRAGVALAANGYSTLGIAGGDAGLTVVWLPDDSRSQSGDTAVRFVHADPLTGPVLVGIATGAGAVPFFSEGAQYASVGAPDASVDRNGYVNMGPLASASMTVGPPDASAPPFANATVSAAAGSVLSFVLLPVTSADAAAPLPRLVECVDNAGTVGMFSNCALQ